MCSQVTIAMNFQALTHKTFSGNYMEVLVNDEWVNLLISPVLFCPLSGHSMGHLSTNILYFFLVSPLFISLYFTILAIILDYLYKIYKSQKFSCLTAMNLFTGIFCTHVQFPSTICWLQVALVPQHVTEVTQYWLFVHAVQDYVTVFLQWAAATIGYQKMWAVCEDLLQPKGSVQFMPTASGFKIYCFNWSAFPNPHLAVAWESQGGTTWRGWHICSPSGCRNIHPISQQVWPSLLIFANINSVSGKYTQCWGTHVYLSIWLHVSSILLLNTLC